jgi:hypothetical protein
VAQHPELRAELEPLLALVARLRALPPVEAPERLRRDPLWRRQLDPARDAASAAPPSCIDPADLLAACLDAAEDPARVAALLDQHPTLREEVEPLLALARQLSTLGALPAPERLRQQPAWREAATSNTPPSAPADSLEPVPFPAPRGPKPVRSPATPTDDAVGTHRRGRG